MTKVVGVRFRPAGKIYYFDPNDIETELGTAVIVETARGLEFGEVVSTVKEVTDEEIVSPLRKVMRIATEEDCLVLKKNKEKEEDATKICEEKIQNHKLDMSLVNVEYAFDGSKIIFYFTSDGRVDFRELVKDLATVFRTRIELRQIGVRDEAKMFGGIGPCGRPLCCATHLGDFAPVSIKMAKQQNLTLNPSKISGICSRLMCCLRYESEHYEAMEKIIPNVGQFVYTPDGPGKVISSSVIKENVLVELEDDNVRKEYLLKEIKKKNGNKCTPKPKCHEDSTNE